VYPVELAGIAAAAADGHGAAALAAINILNSVLTRSRTLNDQKTLIQTRGFPQRFDLDEYMRRLHRYCAQSLLLY
jgi:hypothetical protein